jgi:hypothetical protein
LWNIYPGFYQATGFAASNNRIWVVGNNWESASGFDFYISCIVVPEPSTFALLFMSIVGLAAWGWRWKK